MIYFGDSAHLPYGDKSAATVRACSLKITDILLQSGCKAILIACNSASAAAFGPVRAHVGKRAYVANVIDPVIGHLKRLPPRTKVGLIGTLQTVNSKAFEAKLKAARTSLDFRALAAPLLAPMIEEGFAGHPVSRKVIATYLAHPLLSSIRALVLGCTHYPIIKDDINEFYKGKVTLIDSAGTVAHSLKNKLSALGLLNPQAKGNDRFIVSDHTPAFEKAAALFFNKGIRLEERPLGD